MFPPLVYWGSYVGWSGVVVARVGPSIALYRGPAPDSPSFVIPVWSPTPQIILPTNNYNRTVQIKLNTR